MNFNVFKKEDCQEKSSFLFQAKNETYWGALEVVNVRGEDRQVDVNQILIGPQLNAMTDVVKIVFKTIYDQEMEALLSSQHRKKCGNEDVISRARDVDFLELDDKWHQAYEDFIMKTDLWLRERVKSGRTIIVQGTETELMLCDPYLSGLDNDRTFNKVALGFLCNQYKER